MPNNAEVVGCSAGWSSTPGVTCRPGAGFPRGRSGAGGQLRTVQPDGDVARFSVRITVFLAARFLGGALRVRSVEGQKTVFAWDGRLGGFHQRSVLFHPRRAGWWLPNPRATSRWLTRAPGDLPPAPSGDECCRLAFDREGLQMAIAPGRHGGDLGLSSRRRSRTWELEPV